MNFEKAKALPIETVSESNIRYVKVDKTNKNIAADIAAQWEGNSAEFQRSNVAYLVYLEDKPVAMFILSVHDFVFIDHIVVDKSLKSPSMDERREQLGIPLLDPEYMTDDHRRREKTELLAPTGSPRIGTKILVDIMHWAEQIGCNAVKLRAEVDREKNEPRTRLFEKYFHTVSFTGHGVGSSGRATAHDEYVRVLGLQGTDWQALSRGESDTQVMRFSRGISDVSEQDKYLEGLRKGGIESNIMPSA